MGELIPLNIEVTAIGVPKAEKLSDDLICDGLNAIHRFESQKDWVKADLMRVYQDRHPDAIKQLESRQLEFDFAGDHSALQVATNIPLDHRQISLSFAHHREIAMECGSLAEIDIWLKKAVENEWSLPHLRKQLRSREVDTSKTGKNTGNLEWIAPFATSARQLARCDVDTLSTEERKTLSRTLEPLSELYHKLVGR